MRVRIALPLAQMAAAIVLTVSNYLRPDPSGYPLKEKLDLQLGFALNAPATVLRYFLERLAMQFCPGRYMTGSFSGCYPVGFIFETVVYFGLVAMLWYGVALEAAGRGQSVLALRTRKRVVADILAIIFGTVVGAIGVEFSRQVGSSIGSFLVGITYIVWAGTIIVFYGHDMRVHFRSAKNVS